MMSLCFPSCSWLPEETSSKLATVRPSFFSRICPIMELFTEFCYTSRVSEQLILKLDQTSTGKMRSYILIIDQCNAMSGYRQKVFIYVQYIQAKLHVLLLHRMRAHRWILPAPILSFMLVMLCYAMLCYVMFVNAQEYILKYKQADRQSDGPYCYAFTPRRNCGQVSGVKRMKKALRNANTARWLQ